MFQSDTLHEDATTRSDFYRPLRPHEMSGLLPAKGTETKYVNESEDENLNRFARRSRLPISSLNES